METLTDPGVGLETTADSQLPPPVVAATAVKATPALPVTLMDCAAGAAAPSVYVKLSKEGAAVTLLLTT